MGDAAANQWATSNSTASLFLGGRQPAWMAATASPLDPPRRPARPPSTGTARARPQSTQNTANTQDKTAAGAAAAAAAAPAPAQPPPRCAASAPATAAATTQRTAAPGPVQGVPSPVVPVRAVPDAASVLPSPTPSDDRNTEKTPAGEPDGGGERTHKRRRLGSSAGLLPSTTPQSNNNTPAQAWTASPPLPAAAPPMPTAHVGGPVGGPAPVAAEWSTQACLVRLEQLRCGRSHGINWAPAQAKLHVLEFAVRKNDASYLFFHQVIYLAKSNPGLLPTQISRLPNLHGAISVLDHLLDVHTQPRLGHDMLTWFSDFPVHQRTIATAGWPLTLQESFQAFPVFVGKTSKNWDTFNRSCMKRMCPPTAHEIEDQFGISSEALQAKVFDKMILSVWPRIQAPYIKEAKMLFLETQQFSTQFKNSQWSLAGWSPESQDVLRNKNDSHITRYYDIRHRSLQAESQSLGSSHSTFSPEFQNGMISPGLPNNFAGQGNQYPLYAHPSAQPLRPPTRTASQTSSLAYNQALGQPHTSGTVPQSFYPTFQSPVNHISPPTPPISRQSIPSRPSGYSGQRTPNTSLNSLYQQKQPARTPVSLLPPPGRTREQPAQPNSNVSALHQAHLRSPRLRAKSDACDFDPTQMFQHVTGFAMPPSLIGADKSFQKMNFDVSSADFARVARDQASERGLPPKRAIDESTLMYRVRCARTPNFDESKWVLADNLWPTGLFLRFNEQHLEFRKKLHNGKDLPVDLTPYIREGQNVLEVAVVTGPADNSFANYALAVETVGVARNDAIKQDCLSNKTIPAASIKSGIQKQLTALDDSDELMIVNDTITINIVDPFSGCRICDIPVRGTDCCHRSAFDLDVFLETRPRKKFDFASRVDAWKCPICEADVRPKSLVVDGFLLEVKEKLAEQGLTNTRAIVFEKDGSWKPRPENEADERDASEALDVRSPSTKTAATPATGPAPVEVIDLDSD